MKALILNSGLGHRMGVLTSEHPKCMTEISHRNTILSRQLRQCEEYGIEDVVMTTGYYDQVLIDYCNFLQLPLSVYFLMSQGWIRFIIVLVTSLACTSLLSFFSVAMVMTESFSRDKPSYSS